MDTSTAISSTSTEIADTQQLPATEWRFGDGEEGDWVPRVSVGLTWGKLDVISVMDKVRNDHAGAIVLFAGTTRATFGSQNVTHLSYTAYPPLTLTTLLRIGTEQLKKHKLKGICIIHRLGTVGVGKESILVAVSSPHREAAWRAGEEVLEQVKEKAEIWKKEEFDTGEGAWRANKNSQAAPSVERG